MVEHVFNTQRPWLNLQYHTYEKEDVFKKDKPSPKEQLRKSTQVIKLNSFPYC